MNWANIEDVVALAINEADKKMEAGKLIACDDPDFTTKIKDFRDGDPETIWSIATLYADQADIDYDEIHRDIIVALEKKYPTFF